MSQPKCRILLANYSFTHPEKIEKFQDNEPLYDIDVEEDHTFLVEGGFVVHNSAGGSAKQGRDKRYQAVLPFRGKVINAEKHLINKTMENKEIQSLISALKITPSRSGVVEDVEKLRFHKVIICADKDPDGAHIACLMITFFFKFMRTLIENGHLYVALPPLYCALQGKKKIYIRDQAELESFKENNDISKFDLKRFKGLGEMNPNELGETALNPKTRNVVQITIEDAVEASKVVDELMGSDVDGRKRFLYEELNISAEAV